MGMVPESRATVMAQIEAMLSPSSTKDVVYLSPGTNVPAGLPKDIEIIQKGNGTYLTQNRKKASLIKRTPDSELEGKNGELLYNKKSGGKGLGLLVVATNKMGLPVAEIGTDTQHIQADLQEAQAQAPTGGGVGVTDVNTVLQNRIARLGLEQQIRG